LDLGQRNPAIDCPINFQRAIGVTATAVYVKMNVLRVLHRFNQHVGGLIVATDIVTNINRCDVPSPLN
jgi:hypothetical protein